MVNEDWYKPEQMVTMEDFKEELIPNNVEHPGHYVGTEGLECIEAIRNALTEVEFRGYCKGNILKYTWREAGKNGDEDLKKVKMYADFALEASSE